MDFNHNLRSRIVEMGGIKTSQLCFGTEHINICKPEFGGSILADAAKMHGVFFWDTDNAYGSQTQVAAGLKKVNRKDVVITSKTYGLSAEQAINDVERNLEELGTDYLDYCLLHGVMPGELERVKPALGALLKMKEKGKIRSIGLSTHCPQIAWDASDIPEIQVICVTFNRDGSRILDGTRQGMIDALKKAHRDRNKGTYAIKTLGRGDLIPDLKNALEWVLSYHEYIDVYNLGFANISELREDLTIINNYFDRLEQAKTGEEGSACPARF